MSPSAERLRPDWGIVARQFLLPGWGLLRLGPAPVAITGMILSALGWVGIAVLAVVALVSFRSMVTFATQNSGPWTIIASIVLLALSCATVAIVLIVRLGRRRVATSILVGALATLQIAALAWGFGAVRAEQTLIDTVFAKAGDVASKPVKEALLDQRINILLLGGDAGPGRWGLRPDSISVVSINPSTGNVAIVGIPRNLQDIPFVAGSPMLQLFPNGYICPETDCLLDYLYTIAHSNAGIFPADQYAGQDVGIVAMRDAVGAILGQPIDYSVLMDMQGFAAIVDAVGGVDIVVPVETLGQDRKTVFPQGEQRMDGKLALLYSRTRYDSDDYGRMAKQRLVQEALLRQADPLTVMLAFQQLTDAGTQYVRTDIPRELIPDLVDGVIKSRSRELKTLELVPPAISVLHPDYAWIHEQVALLFEVTAPKV